MESTAQETATYIEIARQNKLFRVFERDDYSVLVYRGKSKCRSMNTVTDHTFWDADIQDPKVMVEKLRAFADSIETLTGP